MLYSAFLVSHPKVLERIVSGSAPRRASRELRDAVTDGPVLLRSVENLHEHVLGTDARIFAEQLRDAPVQRLFLLRRAAVEHGDLDVDDVLAADDAIGGAGA